MKYDHKVKYKGVWYEPFTDIPEIPKTNIIGDYTKTEINRMTTAELQALASFQDTYHLVAQSSL